jgi:hypothetical protein
MRAWDGSNFADARLINSHQLQLLTGEARELLAIFSSSYGTARWKERNR